MYQYHGGASYSVYLFRPHVPTTQCYLEAPVDLLKYIGAQVSSAMQVRDKMCESYVCLRVGNAGGKGAAGSGIRIRAREGSDEVKVWIDGGEIEEGLELVIGQEGML
jgi:hypothetical protein